MTPGWIIRYEPAFVWIHFQSPMYMPLEYDETDMLSILADELPITCPHIVCDRRKSKRWPAVWL
jgi:hypothetical protein